MKYLFSLIAFGFILSCPFFSLSQKNEEKPYKIEHDTMYAMINYDGTILNLPSSPYVRKWWPENGKYRAYLFKANTGNLIRTGWYADKACKIREGVFEEYYENAMMLDSGRYENNKKEGLHLSWYKSGEPKTVFNYKNDLTVDSCFTFFEEGNLSGILILDKEGNGIGQNYYKSGKVKMIGRIVKGERESTWVLKREDGTKMMAIDYLADSVTQTLCFEADGITQSKGDCIYEKPASFPGGNKGWTVFLQKNLRYPDYAIDKSIEGVVRVQFIVAKDGTPSEFKILDSPHEVLSKEVLRLMEKSPNWLPAIQYNSPVIYRQIQAVTFRLR